MRISTTAFVALVLATAINGCDDDDDAACTPEYPIVIQGLPAGVNPDVTVTYGTTTRPAVNGETIRSGNVGPTITSKDVIGADPIVRTVYTAMKSTASFQHTTDHRCGTATTISYLPIATSNKLWHINDQPAQILGFASASLAATGAPAATVAAKAPASKGIAFDRDGNLWAPGAADIAVYDALSFLASGDKTPEHVVGFDPGCAPGVSAIAFASDGALWVSAACGKRVSRLSAADIAVPGAPTPGVVLGSLDAPEGLAFDKAGNLWVADAGSGKLLRYDASSLSTSHDPADLSITLTAAPETSAALPPNHLAFDKDGNLWVSSFNASTIYKLTPVDLSGIATKVVTPAVQIGLAVDVLPEGLAIDESGALWLTLSQGKIGRLGAAQLGTSTVAGTPATPEIIVTSPAIGYAAAPAFFPGAKGTPLYAALP